MDLDEYLDDLIESKGIKADKATKKVLELVKKGISKEEALGNSVSELSDSKKQAEFLLDGVLKILRRDHGWRKMNMLDISNYIEEYFM